jgi:hypothetical protein
LGELQAASADCAGGNGITNILGTTDSFSSTVTLRTGPAVTLTQNYTYLVEFALLTNQAGGTANFNVAIDWPFTPATTPRFHVTSVCDGGGSDAAAITTDNSAVTLNQTANPCIVYGTGTIAVDSGEGGTMTLKFAQGTSNANATTVYANSWLKATPQ